VIVGFEENIYLFINYLFIYKLFIIYFTFSFFKESPARGPSLPPLAETTGSSPLQTTHSQVGT
jgi:hypothetical protein